MKIGLALIGIWTSISIFTQTDIWQIWQEITEYPAQISIAIEQTDYEAISDLLTGEPILSIN